MLRLIGTARSTRLLRYGLPVMLVALAFGLQQLLRPDRVTSPPLFLFLGAVLASNWYGGLPAGLIAIALSTVAAGTTLQPLLAQQASGWRVVLEIAAFVLEGLVVCWMIQTLRTNQQTVLASAQKQKELRRRFRATFEQAAVGLAHVDLDGRWLRVNQKLCDIIGYTSEEFVQLTFQEITYADDLAADLDHVQKLLAGDISAYSLKKRYIRKDGSLVWIKLTVSLVRDSGNRPQYFITVVEDISEAKRGEAERLDLLRREQQARAEAEAANRTKDEFLATLSHELRTPLNAILGWTQLLQKGNLEPPMVDRALETIERNARMQSQLVEDILDVSRIITGNLRLEIKPVNLASVITAAVDSFRLAAQSKDIDLQLMLDQSSGLISGDANRLQQVVWNLLSNAIKFTPKGGQVLVILEQVGAECQLRVQDTGQGIHPDFLPHIFERFRQADGSSTRSHGGLGLGLAIVRHLVELHGGQIQAESRGEDQGAIFIVTLPLQAGEPVLGSSRSLSDAPLLAETRRERLLEGIWVVVVDDEVDARELAAMVLEDRGAVVTLAASAAEALAVFNQDGDHSLGLSRLPDLLVSDIAMPGEDGYALIQNIRTLPPEQGGQVAAIALTACAREEERSQALAAGFQVHLSKPVLPTTLVAKVADLTGRSAGLQQSPTAEANPPAV